uniref:C2H2-type domain-containing protein n=1 Tax=Panagrellus redivivus TaxID=6233 RepID=A0A7E4V202_PANRE
MDWQVVGFLSVFCFGHLFGAPLRSSLEAENVVNEECIFKDYQSTLPVSNAFTHESRPRTTCDDTLISLREIYESRTSFAIELFGAENPIDLMLARVGNFRDRKFWSNKNEVELLLRKHTCKNHWDELFLNWDDKKYSRIRMVNRDGKRKKTYCTYPKEIGGHSNKGQSRTPLGKKAVTKYEAFAILLKTDKIVHVGSKLCTVHDSEVQIMKSEFFPSDSNDDTYVCNMEEVLLFSQRKERKKMLNKCTSQLGYCKLLTIGEYDALSSLSKERKIRSTKKLFLEIAGMVAPERDASFMQEICKVFDDGSRDQSLLNRVCSEVARQYEKAAGDKLTRIIAISTVVNIVSYPELRKYIPSLTEYMYRKAVKYTRDSDIPTDFNKKQRYERYRKDEVIKFVHFLTSPHCLISLPYGVHHTKLSDNSQLDIPHTIRLQRHSEIIRMYNAKRMEETEGYDPLKRTTMFSICHHCYAKRSKALTCVDYYLANGYEAFEYLEEVITEWQDRGIMDGIDGDILKKRLKDGLLYLRTDFNVALKHHTPIISHCLLYALSDPKDIHFQRKCDINNNPSHAILCERCLHLQEALQNIEVFASTQTQSCQDDGECEDLDVEDLKVRELMVRNAVFNIAEMKKHLVRTKYSELQRKSIIDTLNDNSALITLDFAQKLLPMKFRETQRDYYGKKGMSYHISHVLSNISGSAVEHVFVHILDDTKQDAASIIAIVVDVLRNVSKCGITDVILRSDNAPNYHNRDVILSLPRISEITGVRIQRYAFSEPQAGKSACDRHAALVKNRVRDYVDTIHNVLDTAQFFTALKTPYALNYTTISKSTVQPTRKARNRKGIVGISTYYDFIPEEDGIRAWKFYGIGDGRLYEYEKYGVPQTLPMLLHENIYNPLDNDEPDYWRSSSKKKRKRVSQKEVFECPEETCDASFESMLDLEAHLFAGVHTDQQEEIKPLRDLVLRTFVDSIADLTKVDDPIEAAIRDNIIDDTQLTDLSLLAEGWAQKSSRDNPKFTMDSKKFLTEMFDEGELSKQKTNGAKAVRAMRAAKTVTGAKRFKAHELLRADQITSFFSRLSASRKKDAAEPLRKRQRLNEPDDDDNDETYDDPDSAAAEPSRKRQRLNEPDDDVDVENYDDPDSDAAESRRKRQILNEPDDDVDAENYDDPDFEAAEFMDAARNELREMQYIEIEQMIDNVFDNIDEIPDDDKAEDEQ